MAKQRSRRQGKGDHQNAPVEIPMTDLDWSEDEAADDLAGEQDIHAAGTPGGGAASGGLAGSNRGDGDPANVDLEDALGSGVLDTDGEDKGGPPYSGAAGGAVGGTPAEKRARGGRHSDRFVPGGDRPIDSTIGSPPKRGS